MSGKAHTILHFGRPKSKLEDPFTSLFYRRDWPEKPYEIHVFKKTSKNTVRDVSVSDTLKFMKLGRTCYWMEDIEKVVR